MKTTTLLPLRGFYSALMLLLFCTKVFSQPDYSFTSYVRVTTGTGYGVGEAFRFKEVKPGVDAIVTITDSKFVTLSDLDGTGNGGFNEAFQPEIFCPARKKGYVEFRFDFVIANTNTPVTMPEVPLTAIDIDGEQPNEKLYELDEFQKTAASYVNYSTIGSSLDVFVASDWYTAINNSAITYPGVDTAQTDVMFTMVHGSVSSFYYRTGADNKSSVNRVRLRSVYFKKFSYPNGLLASDALMNFKGNALNGIVNLQYQLNESSKIQTVVIERAASDMNFKAVQETAIQNNTIQYQVRDAQIPGISYYRLKIIQHSGATSYSNVLKFDNNAVKEVYKVFPSAVDDRVTIMLYAANAGASELKVIDYSGRVVYTKTLGMQRGVNNATIDGLGALSRGNYVVTVRSGSNVHSQKIMKQ